METGNGGKPRSSGYDGGTRSSASNSSSAIISLLEKDLQFKQWVESGSDSYHLPICLEVLRNPQKPASPFKFCAAWLKHEEVLRLIHSNWIPYGAEARSHAATHFVQNLV